MCTIGVLRLPDGAYALFKNKDFGRRRFDDRITIERDVFGVAGLATFADDDPDRDEFSGLSIGANASGLLCCDANVRTVAGHDNYDELVEIALREATGVGEAVEAIGAAVVSRPYCWANLVLIDAGGAAVVEVRGHDVHVSTPGPPIVRTNHHVSRGPVSGDDNTTTSAQRLTAAERGIETIDSVGGVFDLLRSHDPDGASLCVHGPPQTVYSYVLVHGERGTTLSVIQGPPCETATPTVLDIPFGALWSPGAAADFRRIYPSGGSDTPG